MKDGRYVNEWGTESWYKDDKIHREEGPARIFNSGEKEWWMNGDCHREDGPAIIGPNGEKQWWLNHVRFSKEDWWERISDESKFKALFNGEGL
jgi:hypothetical protein